MLESIAAAVGPAPWYWKTFPGFEIGGRQYVWRCDVNPERRVLLVTPDRPTHALLAINIYTRVFFIPPGLIGLWFEDGPILRVLALDPDSLTELEIDALPPASPRQHFFGAGQRILSEFCADCRMDEGEHGIDIPLAFARMEHLLMIGPCSRVQEAACAAIFEVKRGSRPGTDRIAVYPQKWFNSNDFDLGFEWITRVARDAKSGRLVGDGIRIRPFVLREDGMHLDRWLSK